MGKYMELLLALLDSETCTITVKVNVALSSLRRGMNKALQDYNDSQMMLEFPTESRSISINTVKTNTYNISLVDSAKATHTKLQFKLL